VVLHEWSVPEEADVEDMEVVKAANPFSGITIESLREKKESPTMTLTHWRRFVCNLPTRSSQAAITEAEWHAAQTDKKIPKGEPIWLGLDVAWKWDTTAAVPLWWKNPEFRLLGDPRILTPPSDGNMLDPYLVQHAIAELHERNPIEMVVMDMSGAADLAAWIQTELGAEVVEHPQGLPMQVKIFNSFMEALRQGWLFHTGDPELRRHVMNAIARMLPRGDSVFERQVASRYTNQERRVIDALDAAAMVHYVAAQNAAQLPKAKPKVISLV
jgi:phage terminase large subunit-like protein